MSMYRLSLTSFTTPALLFSAAMLMPTARFVPASRAQADSTDVHGSSDRPAEELDSTVVNAEAYDKASVGAKTL